MNNYLNITLPTTGVELPTKRKRAARKLYANTPLPSILSAARNSSVELSMTIDLTGSASTEVSRLTKKKKGYRRAQ